MKVLPPGAVSSSQNLGLAKTMPLRSFLLTPDMCPALVAVGDKKMNKA